jgi:hypothetical protein
VSCCPILTTGAQAGERRIRPLVSDGAAAFVRDTEDVPDANHQALTPSEMAARAPAMTSHL